MLKWLAFTRQQDRKNNTACRLSDFSDNTVFYSTIQDRVPGNSHNHEKEGIYTDQVHCPLSRPAAPYDRFFTTLNHQSGIALYYSLSIFVEKQINKFPWSAYLTWSESHHFH